MMTNEPITQLDLERAMQTASLATQMAEVIKDIGGLNLRMDQHEARHEQEKRDRLSARRWMIATAIAFLACIDGPIIYLIQAHR